MKGESIHDGDIEMPKKDSYSYTEADAVEMKLSMRKFGRRIIMFNQANQLTMHC